MSEVLRLAILLFVGQGRRGWLRLSLTAVGTAIGVWCLLMALALPGVLRDREERSADRYPVSAKENTDGAAWYSVIDQRIDGRNATIVFVADPTPDTPMPPGVDSWAGLGEAIVSPALAEALDSNPALISGFPYEPVARIGDEGLVGPDELFAYVVVDRSALGDEALPLGRYGVSWFPAVDLAEGDIGVVQLSLIGLVLAPLAVYFTVVASLSAATRSRRLAALRLVGLSSGDLQMLNALDSVFTAVIGSGLGVLVYAVLNAPLAGIGIAGLVWFPSDSAMTTGSIVLVVVVALGAAVMVNRVGSHRVIHDALAVRQHAPSSPGSLWRLIPLIVGLSALIGLLGAATALKQNAALGGVAPLLLVLAVVLTIVGVALGMGVISSRLARWLGQFSERLWVQLAVNRYLFEPSAATRVVVGLVVVIVVMGFQSGLQRDRLATAGPMGEYSRYVVSDLHLPTDALALVRAIDGVQATAVIAVGESHAERANPGEMMGDEPNHATSQDLAPSTDNGLPVSPVVDITFATCADFAVIVDTSVDVCRDGVSYRLDAGLKPGEMVALTPGSGSDPESGILAIPEGALAMPRPGPEALFVGQILLPPESLPTDLTEVSVRLLIVSDSDPEIVSKVASSLASLTPTASIRFVDDNFELQSQVLVFMGLLRVSLLLGVVVAVVALVVASIDRAIERRSNIVALRLVGVPTRLLRKAQAAQAALPMVAGAATAIGVSKMIEQATVAVGGFGVGWQWRSMANQVVVALVMVAIVAVGAALALGRRIDVSLIRRE